VWVDESADSPQQATWSQLSNEAISAAAHFGNTTAASNRNAQYVILSPTGTNPDGFNTPTGHFCAWHDYTPSPSGDLAFTNMPYVTDAGSTCGSDFVNNFNGSLDGVSIVEGHEYYETITDQNPGGGWTDPSLNEIGDKCAWISPGTSGGAANLTLATGTFAVQSMWANDANNGAGGCDISHPIITNPVNTVTVTNPGNQTGHVGTAASLQIHATDSDPGQTLTYTATVLPAGLSINSATGLISGHPTTWQTALMTVIATDTTGVTGSASFSWTISPSADLSAAIAAPATAHRSGRVTVTVTITNNGPNGASRVLSALQFDRSWHVTNAGGGTPYRNGLLFRAPGLRKGATLTYTVTLTAPKTAGQAVFTIGTGSKTWDPYTGNNVTTTTIQVT
jgi:serine protease